jgi:hypothetical protein
MQKDYHHLTSLYPFADRPDVAVPVVWYPVPMGTPCIGFESPFVMRNWDRLNMDSEPSLGTKYDPKLYLTSPPPSIPPGEPCGTAEQWHGQIDYDTWAAGGYSCDCQGVSMGVYVIDVYDPTGSITVSPHDAHVLVNVNDTFAHHWLAGQIFSGGNPADVPLTIAFGAAQTAALLLITNQLGNTQFEIRPPLDDATTPILYLARRDGTVLVSMYDGGINIEAGETGAVYNMAVADPVTFSGQSFKWIPNRLICQFVSRLAAGVNVAVGSSTVLSAQLEITESADSTDPPLRVVTTTGDDSTETFRLDNGGTVSVFGQLHAGMPVGGEGAQIVVTLQSAALRGILVQGATDQFANLVELTAADYATRFAVGATGNLMTNQTQGASGPLGTLVARLPIYDAEGTLVGWVPIYDLIAG